MNVNINNFAINQVADNIIRSNYSNSSKGMFENMLNNAMAENQKVLFLGEDFSNLSIDRNSLVEANVEGFDGFEDFEDNDETQKHISYENINVLADIFFFRPNIVKSDVITQNTVLNVEYGVHKNQFNPKGIEQKKGLITQEKQEINLAIPKNNNAEKLISEIEIDSNKIQVETKYEKSKIEHENAEFSAVDSTIIKNKIILVSDESTKIKSQVLSQVKDKITIMTEKGQELNSIKTITMELQPQNLGKVDIKLIYDNNKLTVEIKALNEETQKIISSNAGELKDLLSKSSETDVNIIVKPHELELKHQPVHNNQNTNQDNGQNFYQNNDQNHQGRQRNKYYYENNIKQKEEDIFSELIDISNLKVKEGKHGN